MYENKCTKHARTHSQKLKSHYCTNQKMLIKNHSINKTQMNINTNAIKYHLYLCLLNKSSTIV